MKLSQFLSEARTVAGEAASKRGLSHAGHGYYADRQGNIVAKSVGGERLVAVDKSEAQQAQQGAEQGSAEDAHKEENGGEGLGHIALTFGRCNPPTIGHENFSILLLLKEQITIGFTHHVQLIENLIH